MTANDASTRAWLVHHAKLKLEALNEERYTAELALARIAADVRYHEQVIATNQD